jgi:hypothetical protein
VIVVSILLAFAIDAWWEERIARNFEVEQLVRVSAELEANSERLQRKIDTISAAIEGAGDFISWMGPKPIDVSADVYRKQWGKFYSIGTLSVLRSAAQDYLATGRAGKARHEDIRHALAVWHTDADELEDQYDLLRVAHANINDYLQNLVPLLHDITASGAVDENLASKFPYDHGEVLADPLLESRMAIYLIRLEFVLDQALDLQQQQSELMDIIVAATRE